ncbi:hypothetical protein HZ994_02510 [Akkermansiaceae bacterium]|nr:hypothetical protein HZ994_02510 [Akkermansiaceae bacterium]
MNIVEDAIKSLADLGVEVEKAKNRHRREFTANEGDDYNIARIFVDGLIASIFLKTNKPIQGITPEGEYQILIGASFVRTHALLHDLILDGHIIDSHCLLRKQLEQLARLQELETKSVSQLRGKTPNIKNAISGIAGTIYGAQSKIAHFADTEVGYSLLETHNFDDHSRVSALPSYSENSVFCMNSRLFLAVQFAAWFVDKLTR